MACFHEIAVEGEVTAALMIMSASRVGVVHTTCSLLAGNDYLIGGPLLLELERLQCRAS